MSAFTAIIYLPWALACALAFKSLLELKNTLDQHSWEVNILMLCFGWLVLGSFHFHKMALATISSLVHWICNKLGPLHFLSRQPIISALLLVYELYEILLAVMSFPNQLEGADVGSCYNLPVESLSEEIREILCASVTLVASVCCIVVSRHVPHEWKVVRYSFSVLAAALAPWYVLGSTMVLVKVPPILATILLGARLG